MPTLTMQDLEQDQQEVIEKTDIQQLSGYCLELQALEDDIAAKEEELRKVKEKADKIASEIIPNMLAEQGLSTLKLADGSSIEVVKTYSVLLIKKTKSQRINASRKRTGDLIKIKLPYRSKKAKITRHRNS